MRIQSVFIIVVSLWSCVACQGVDSDPGESFEGERGSSARALPPFPDEAELCAIVYNESTSADVTAELGDPADVTDSGGGSLDFFYEYDGGAMLFIGFQRDVFVDAMVDNAPYPSCWSAQEAALNAGLEGLRSKPMSN